MSKSTFEQRFAAERRRMWWRGHIVDALILLALMGIGTTIVWLVRHAEGGIRIEVLERVDTGGRP